MKVIPIIRCKNIQESLFFYTRILDFEIPNQGSPALGSGVTLRAGMAEIQLSTVDGAFGSCIHVRVDNIDQLFQKYMERGLKLSRDHTYALHKKPTDRSWGMREFYVEDPDGNTLRFGQPIAKNAAYS